MEQWGGDLGVKGGAVHEGGEGGEPSAGCRVPKVAGT